MMTLNYSTIVDRWTIVGNKVVWQLGEDIVLDETPIDDLSEEVRAVVLAEDHGRGNFFLELFGVLTAMEP